ncbi:hypothetical protein HDU84_008303, partial [Entophlyctis sp. JEL0112]
MIFGACVFLGTALLQVTNAVSMNSYAQNLFEETLAWQDEFWDEAAGYLVTADLTLPGRWDTRQTAWYSTGLLARNGTGDVARAKRIINQVIDMQYTTPGVAWYGTYQQSPEEPLPGTSLYGTEVYTNFDPNWRDFICTSWIIAIEEFSDLLGDDLVEKMVSSMNISALGALTRVGLNGDNLLLTYTNPELMRTMDEYAPLPETPLRAWHVADYGFGHLVSLTSDIVLANTPDSALASFKEFLGERSFTRHMRSSQSNDTFRTDTAWLNATHMIGGQQ